MPDARHQPAYNHRDEASSAGTIEAVKGAAASAAEQARTALGQSRESARDVARRTAEQVEANPLAVLVGGIGLGALIGALIPRSQRERELLAPVGKRIAEASATAVAAAKERAYAELGERGLNASGLKDQAKSLVDGLTKAVSGDGSDKGAAKA